MSIPLGRESAPPTQMKQCIPSHPQLARALYDNMAESPDELAFRRGELLAVLEQDTAGSLGWWLCSLRGRQGICPGNRLRLVSGPLEGAPPRTARRSAAATPRALSPQPTFTKLPPTSTAVSAAEQAYDVPRAPVAVSAAGPGAWYETPRPASADSACSAGAYDVPRARALPLPRDAALDALERLQAEAAAAVARLLAHVRPGWRRREALAESALDVRVAAARLRAALHDLAVFADAALANAAEAQDKGLSVKMRPLVKALKDAERVTHEATSALEAGGWSVERLARDADAPPADDALDRLVTCARALTEDVRRAASFIQGNAPLLFPRAPPAAAWTEEYDYVRLESRAALERKHAEIRAALPDKLRSSFDALVRDADSAAGEASAAAGARPDADDRRLAAFYAAQAATYGAHLAAAVDAFLRTLRLEQPPPVFLAHGKFVVLSAHRLVHVGDTVHRSAQHAGLRARALRCSDALSEALAGAVAATKAAAQRFPCARAASEATSATRSLAERALELRRSLVAAAAADPPHD